MRALTAIAAVLALLTAGCVGIGGDEEILPSDVATALDPVATVQPESGPVTTVFTFDASQSAVPKGVDAVFTWDFGDGETAEGKTVDHTFRYDNNAYRVKLTVLAAGIELTDTVTVPVGSGVNTAPEGKLDVPTAWAKKGEPVVFRATATDADGDAVEVVWLRAKNIGEGGGHAHAPGEEHGHGAAGGDPFDLATEIGVTGPTLEHVFEETGQYRITASLRDVKGARTDIEAVIKVSESPPRDHLTFTESNQLAVGTASQGASLILYELIQPSQNNYIDAARYDFRLQYPAKGTAALTFSGAGGAGPADLDLAIVKAESGQAVATFDTVAPTVAGPATEGGDITLPPGSYTAYVLAKAGALIDYGLTLDLVLDIPELQPFTVHSAGHEDAGAGHGDGHDHAH